MKMTWVNIALDQGGWSLDQPSLWAGGQHIRELAHTVRLKYGQSIHNKKFGQYLPPPPSSVTSKRSLVGGGH